MIISSFEFKAGRYSHDQISCHLQSQFLEVKILLFFLSVKLVPSIVAQRSRFQVEKKQPQRNIVPETQNKRPLPLLYSWGKHISWAAHADSQSGPPTHKKQPLPWWKATSGISGEDISGDQGFLCSCLTKSVDQQLPYYLLMHPMCSLLSVLLLYLVNVQPPFRLHDEDTLVHSTEATQGAWLGWQVKAALLSWDCSGRRELERHLTHIHTLFTLSLCQLLYICRYILFMGKCVCIYVHSHIQYVHYFTMLLKHFWVGKSMLLAMTDSLGSTA